MPKKGRVSNADADLQMMRLRRENMVAHHRAVREERQVMESIQAAQLVKNMQNEYGALLEASMRLPVGLQREALQRMQNLGISLQAYRESYPKNFPTGPDPNSQAIRRARQRYV